MNLNHPSFRVALLAAALSSVVSCTTNLEGPKIDYRGSGSKTVSLDVPPDLSQLARDDRFAVPDSGGRGTASASQLAAQSNAAAAASNSAAVLPTASSARIERNGNQRWLVVNQPVEQTWPIVREFWIQNGFGLTVENREAGLLETDWAEDRAKLPKTGVRRYLGIIGGSMFDTGERDRFRTRLERVDNGTEIYISHRGAEEVLNASKDGTIWQPRANDPNLEAEFLQRLLVRFDGADTAAKSAAANGAPVVPSGGPARARLVSGADGGYVEIDDSLDRAWRRVGLALDRTGFTVEERDRGNGVYMVRYVDNAKDKAERGLFAKIFSREPQAKPAQQYRIALRGQADKIQVAVQTKDGKPDNSDVAQKILKVLNDELK